ncbi:ATP-binding protein [Sphaerisporangium fuscum]|uniref:ATP-binding protein n=1 Tax=Sphaerisporangium fuscum TaxID=2835868 RepID=UPI001BDC9FF1|nr:ATP-binding protein [Sphaerisporangium fuscum]
MKGKGVTAGTLPGVIDLVGSPESVARAREFIRRKLREDHPAFDDVTLLTSEVVTNAVVHSDSRCGGKVIVALADCHDFIHVDVVDAGAETTPCVRQEDFTEGGRGLMLVETLSSAWGTYDHHRGRTVWFQVKYKR